MAVLQHIVDDGYLYDDFFVWDTGVDALLENMEWAWGWRFDRRGTTISL